MKHRICLYLSLTILLAIEGYAEEGAATPPSMEEIRVDGALPGPALWKVTRGDDPEGHAMWIAADLQLLPRSLKWKSSEIEAIVTAADEVLLMPEFDVQPSGQIGIGTGLHLLRSVLRARRNPNDRRLRDVVPQPLYEAWREQKRIYMPRSRSVEYWRPIFAVHRLEMKALAKLRLREEGIIWSTISKFVERRDIRTTRPTVRIEVPANDLRHALGRFLEQDLPDTECFDISLQLIQQVADGARMRARANAWATADLLALSELDKLPEPTLPCTEAMLHSTLARQFVPADLGERFAQAWTNEAERSLAMNRSTVAILPFSEVVDPNGLVGILKSKGYRVSDRTGASIAGASIGHPPN